MTPTRDYVKGQRTVRMENGREFAIIRGRRWTRIPEYLSNGQLTARWFVDEATGEVRLADSWKSPKSWPLAGADAEFVRALLTLPTEEESAPGEFDGYVTVKGGALLVEAAGVRIAEVGTEEMETAKMLLGEHCADRPRWLVGEDGHATRIG